VGLDLDQRIGHIGALFDQLAPHRNRDAVALAHAEPAVDFDVQVHGQVRADVPSAHRVCGLYTVDLQCELLDSPAVGSGRPGID
jgi:hypothetical protein